MRNSVQGDSVPEQLFTVMIPFHLIHFRTGRKKSKSSIGTIDFEAFIGRDE